MLLNGGIPEQSAIMVEGGPGTGKTTLAMQYVLQGAQKGEPSLYITFEELPEQLYKRMSAFGWSLKRWEQQGLLRIISMDTAVFCTDMLEADGVFAQLLAQTGCRRLVIDSMSLLRYMYRDDYERRAFLYTLRNVLQKKGITSLFIYEETKQLEGEHYVLDGLIRLASRRHNGRLERVLRIEKMRGAAIQEEEQPYTISSNGIMMLPASSTM